MCSTFARILLLPCLLTCAAMGAPLGTSFTYQGRLAVDGSPATGIYDMRMALFDASTGPAQVGTPFAASAVAVTNGLFRLALDFGPAAFDGSARWLEISVRTNAAASSFVTLSPRQPLTAEPYALWAATAGAYRGDGAAITNLNAASLTTGKVPNAALSAEVALLPRTQTFTGRNTFMDNVAIGTPTTTNQLEIAGLLPRARMSSTGLFGPALELRAVHEDPSTLGSIDFTHTSGLAGQIGYSWSGMDFLTANRPRMRLDSAGNLGVGTLDPAQRLDVRGQLQVQDSIRLDAADKPMIVRQWDTFSAGNKVGFGRWGLFMEPTALNLGVPGTDYPLTSSIGLGGWLADGTWQNWMTIREGGNVGIGTTDPLDALHLEGVRVNARLTTTGSINSGSVLQLINTTPNASMLGALIFAGDDQQDYVTLKAVASQSVSPARLEVSCGSTLVANFEAGGIILRSFSQIFSPSSTPPLFLHRDGDGLLLYFMRNGDPKGSITVSGETVSYNAFTGSHFAWAEHSPLRGQLLRMTGANRRFGDSAEGEVVYGVAPTTRANDPACLGSYLALMDPSQTATATNPHLVMAVGNGELWVTDSGGDIEPGDCLISSDLEGCAIRHHPAQFPVGHVVARAAERVSWSTVEPGADGFKRQLISVLFTSFDRTIGDPPSVSRVISGGTAPPQYASFAQQVNDGYETMVQKELRALKAENAALHRRLERLERILATETTALR